jgi:hypothetical protein
MPQTQRKATAPQPPPLPPILAGFRPVSDLWQGDSAPSEQSVRWDLRRLRSQLTEAGALAYRHGRLLVHPERYAAVIERDAIDQARRRHAA